MGELADNPDEIFTLECVIFLYDVCVGVSLLSFVTHPREHREHRIFRILLQMVPRLEERLMEGFNEDVAHIADLVCIIF